MAQNKHYGLVADIGGTNARFALIELHAQSEIVLLHQQTLRCANYASLLAAVEAYLADINESLTSVDSATLAVAGPVDDDWFAMTNNPWEFSIKATADALALQSLSVINDYTAIAYAIPWLKLDGYVEVGNAKGADPTAPVAIIGPGTGLGVGGFVRREEVFIPLNSEGGHSHFAPLNALEIDILHFLVRKYGRVSNERLLSGPGLEDLYQALAHIQDRAVKALTAAEITQAAIDDSDTLASDTVNQFCASLGSVAGDLALCLGAKGGVYIAGGIVPRFIDFFQHSPFRERFTAKGRFSAYNSEIPTRVITAPQPGLLGAAAHQLSLDRTQR